MPLVPWLHARIAGTMVPTPVRAARTRGVVILSSMVESPPSGTPCARCGSLLRAGARHCAHCLARNEGVRAALQAALGHDHVMVAVVGDAGHGVRVHARERRSGRDLLLTIIDPPAGPAARARMRAVVASQPARHHRGLVAVEALLEVGDLLAVVSPWRTMTSLAHALEPNAQMEMADVLRVLDGVVSGVRPLHRRAHAHGALAPDTVCLEPDGAGVAIEPGVLPALFGEQPAGAFAPYAAPEIWRGLPPTPRSDQYALGALAFRLLTGRAALQASTPSEMAHLHETGLVPPLFVFRPGLASEVDVAIRRAMAKDPAHRFSSVEEFLEALVRAAGAEWRVEEAPTEQRAATPTLLSAIPMAMAALALMTAAGFAVPETRPTMQRAWRGVETSAYAMARSISAAIPGADALRERLRPPRPGPLVTATDAAAGTSPGPARAGPVGLLPGGAPASGVPVTAAPAPSGAPVAVTAAGSATSSPRASRRVAGANDSAAVPGDRAERVENRFGFLRVGGTGEVRVDGRYMGAAPLVVRIPVGLHLVTLTVDGRPLAPGSYPVAITEDDTSTARFAP